MTLLTLLTSQVPASFWDPGDNGYDVGDAGTLLVFLVGVAGVLWATTKFLLLPQIHSMVVEEVTKATAPIQVGANGGYSLPDVARKGDWTGEALKAIADHMGVPLPDDLTLAKDVPHEKHR